MFSLDMHQVGRRAGPLLARGTLAAFLAVGSLSGGVSDTMAKTLTGSDEPASTTVVVAHSGNGARMRTAADAEVLDVFPDGTSVTLRTGIDGTYVDRNGTRWWPVVVYGENGWIAGDYLDDNSAAANSSSTASASSSSSSSDSSSSSSSDSSSRAFASGDRVAVQTDDGAGLAMRDASSTDGKRIAALGNGDVVTIVSGPETDANGDGWYKINDGDTNAWVFAKYLVPADQAAPASGASIPSFGEGDKVAVASDDGTGLAMRDEPSPSGKRIAALGDGDVVTVVSGPETDSAGGVWYQINDGDTNAWVAAKYLIAAPATSASSSNASSSSSSSSATTPPEEAGVFSAGDHVTAAAGPDGVNLRKKQGTSGEVLGSLSASDVAEVVGGPKYDSAGNAWYKVNLAGLEGYAREDYLVGTSAAVTEAAAAASAAPAQAAPAAPAAQFIYPLASFTLTQPYGCTGFSVEPWNATLGCYFHNGVDLAANAYSLIMATAAGTVTAAGWCDCGLGFYVTIDHGNGFSSTYGHMAEQPYVAVGQHVNQGDVIGPVGSTGASTGPHTHFILMLNGVTVDPLQYVG